jgi:hypothetical protein
MESKTAGKGESLRTDFVVLLTDEHLLYKKEDIKDLTYFLAIDNGSFFDSLQRTKYFMTKAYCIFKLEYRLLLQPQGAD